MKPFFQNIWNYIVFIVSTILAVCAIYQFVDMSIAIGHSGFALSSLYIFELSLIFVVAIILFTDWWLNLLNKLLNKPISTHVVDCIKTYLKIGVMIIVAAFVVWQALEIMISFIKASQTLYTIEICILIIVGVILGINYFRKEIIKINTDENPF